MLQLEQTNHAYYCSSSNYYVGGPDHGQESFESWKDFTSEWCYYVDGQLEIDRDLALCFRYDMYERNNKTFELELFFILPRKGNYVPVTIKEVHEEDLPEINQFLSKYKQYLFNLWDEIDIDPTHESHQISKEDTMERATSVIKRVDDLGRILIPKYIRRELKIHEGTPMEIFIDKKDASVTFKKYDITQNARDQLAILCQAIKEVEQDIGLSKADQIQKHIVDISNVLNDDN